MIPPVAFCRVVIADDEPPARRTLHRLLAAHPAITVVAECDHGQATVDAIRAHRPDVVFLDIQMPGLTGIDVVGALAPADAPAIVFVTAYDEYAVRAFEAEALDYLLKPFSDERFAACLARVRRSLDASTRGRATGRIVVRDGRRTLVIPWSEIDWIEAEDYYIRVHAGDRHPLVRRSMKSMAGALDAARFVRIHRSTIVNVDRIRQVVPLASGDADVHLADGSILRASRGVRAALETRLPLRPSRA